MKVDLEKLICSMIQKSTLDSIITKCLKDQGIEYKDGSLHYIDEKEVEKPEPVNFEDFPREEQLKWYICTKSIPQKDGGFMPLFCEGEHATIEKIFDMLPELKNDTTLFTEHFRKVTEVDLPKEKPSTIKFKEDLNDVEKLTEVTSQVPHPKMYYHLLRDELPLMKKGQYIVTERVQVETLQEFRNKAASLEESKLFLPLLDSEIERLLNLERLHLSRIAGFVVPKEIRFLERH